jgi:transcription antitermination factor NusG
LVHIENGGFEAFVPLMTTFKTAAVPARIVPIFIGYIFVHVIDRPWQRLRRTVGVMGIVMSGETPSRCPDAEIAALRARLDDQGVIRLPPPPPPKKRIAAGTRVAIVAGPFEGFSAIHTGMTAHDREIVLLELLGRATRVEIGVGSRYV